MPITTNPEWQQVAIYAVGAAVLLLILFRIPFLGRVLRALFSVALLAVCLYFLVQQAAFEPGLARFTEKLGLSSQEVSGEELRIRMSPDGHFWAKAQINGLERRMLIDSGATITALSEDTARLASVESGVGMLPVLMRTANGTVKAETGNVQQLTLGEITANDLKVVISPALGGFDVLGMNFLSQLDSWRVEQRTLILVPEGAADVD